MIVGVIGSGSIGPDLAYGFLSALVGSHGAKVYLLDIKQEALDAGRDRIFGYVKKGVARGKLSSKAAASITEMFTPTLEMSDLSKCDYVLEAASEDLGVKKQILAKLEAAVRSDCLIGFATSGLPRRMIAEGAKHPERTFVNHPFFPAWRSLPVEVVLSGDEGYGAKMMATLKRLGKVPIETKDVECFAADDIFCNYVAEAARIVEEGVANAAQVDKIVNDAIGGGGPLNVMDATSGNLLTAHCLELMEEAETGTAWFKSPAILKERGNQPWHDRARPEDSSYSPELGKEVLDRILAVLYGRTYFVVEQGICHADDLDWMTRMALGFSKGLLTLAEETGASKVREICQAYAAKHEGFEVPLCIQEARLPSFAKNVRSERLGDVGIVRVWRPEVKNALSAQTIKEINAAMIAFEQDASITGIVFTSYDGSLAGADINELAALASPQECEDLCNGTHPLMERMGTMRIPVVAAVDGPVLGGGAEFSMACHARVVGKKLMLGQPEVNLGIIPGYGGTQRLPRLVGVARGLSMMRNAQTIQADKACEWGWATGEPVDHPVQKAIELIHSHAKGDVELPAMSTEALETLGDIEEADIGHRSLAIDAILVEVVKRGLRMPMSDGLKLEAEGFGRCRKSVDMGIGMTNFIQNGPRVPAQFLHE